MLLTVNDTTYSPDKVLSWRLTPAHDMVYFAYAPIYGYQDHLDYLANLSSRESSVPFGIRTLGMSSQGRPVDLITIGKGGACRRSCMVVSGHSLWLK